jgi:predicted dehydrogenase
MFIECENGSIELGPDFWVRVTTERGTLAKRCVPPHYAWADPTYAAIHPSIVDCNADLLRALQSGEPAATSGEDNLETMRLVSCAYESARTGQVIQLK